MGKLEGQVYDCGRMPEVMESIFTEENMPGVPEDTRKRLRYMVPLIEGSSPKDGMTCIATEDYPRLTAEILRMEGKDHFNNDPLGQNQASLRDFFQSLNRHCDECTRRDCDNRVRVTRDRLVQLGRPVDTFGLRQAKVVRDFVAQQGTGM